MTVITIVGVVVFLLFVVANVAVNTDSKKEPGEEILNSWEIAIRLKVGGSRSCGDCTRDYLPIILETVIK